MASFKTTVLALAIALPVTFAQSSGAVPPCLNQCLAQTTQPCTPDSLPLLINCVNSQCTTRGSSEDINGTSAATAAAAMTLTYTPKIQYSCQQSFLPGSEEEAPSMQLTGDGKCMTSPYDFQSLFVSTDDDGGDDEGEADGVTTLQKMARQCSMTLSDGEECEGEETKLDLGDLQGDKCVFQSGRSARLVCTPFEKPETPSYASILSSLCSGANADGGPNGTSPAANNTTSPYGGGGADANDTSSSLAPSIPVQSSSPYTGRASGDQVAKPSLIALVALFAVAVLVL